MKKNYTMFWPFRTTGHSRFGWSPLKMRSNSFKLMMRKRENPHHRVWATRVIWRCAVHTILYDVRTTCRPCYDTRSCMIFTRSCMIQFNSVVNSGRQSLGLPELREVWIGLNDNCNICKPCSVQFNSVVKSEGELTDNGNICKPCSVQFNSVVKSEGDT